MWQVERRNSSTHTYIRDAFDNINTIVNNDVIDIICFYIVCPEGFIGLPGDGIQDDLGPPYKPGFEQCSKDCLERINCNSFKYGFNDKYCTLMKKKVPEFTFTEQEYQFCAKAGKFRTLWRKVVIIGYK